MNKKIAIFKSKIKKIGGLEKQAYFISKALAERGYEIFFLTEKPKRDIFFHKNISFHFCKNFLPFNFLRLKKFDNFCKKFIEKRNVKISFGLDRTSHQTHIRAGNGVHRAYLENRKKNESFFKRLSFFLNPLHRSILKIEKRSFENENLKKIIVNSKRVKNQILKYYRVDPKKIEVIYNGVEWENMRKDFDSWFKEKESIAKKLKVDSSKFFFLFIGNGYSRKGLKVLLDAFVFVKKKDFHLLVVGRDKNLKKFQEYANFLKMEKKVSFFGERRDIANFYKLSDCLVIPSFYDPFANVTLEALAMGLFVVSSKENGASEILNEKNGIVLESLEPKEIAFSLKEAFRFKKSVEGAKGIRNSVRHLNFSNQLNRIMDSITS
jgi:UDP-glucose:(heptosyl)LPS alpha-1,3-glucosyltransferase